MKKALGKQPVARINPWIIRTTSKTSRSVCSSLTNLCFHFVLLMIKVQLFKCYFWFNRFLQNNHLKGSIPASLKNKNGINLTWVILNWNMSLFTNLIQLFWSYWCYLISVVLGSLLEMKYQVKERKKCSTHQSLLHISRSGQKQRETQARSWDGGRRKKSI